MAPLPSFVEKVKSQKSLVPRPNPFFSGYAAFIDLLSHDTAQVAQRRQLFTQIMKEFGPKIMHLRLSLNDAESVEMSESIYMFVRSLLILTPNLVSLKFEHFLILNNRSYQDFEKNSASSMSHFLKSNPLPALEKLVHLNLFHLPFLLEYGLMSKYTNAKSLHCLSFPNENRQVYVDFIGSMVLNGLHTLEFEPACRQDLTTLESLAWPLKSLKVSPAFKIGDGQDWNFVCKSVSSMSTTLEHFMIEQSFCRNKYITEIIEKLELPRLKTFKMNVCNTILTNIDFLLPSCTSLTHLELRTHLPHIPGKLDTNTYEDCWSLLECRRSTEQVNVGEQVIQFFEYVGSMYESNIWKLLPKLETIEINVTIKTASSIEIGKRYRYKREVWSLLKKVDAGAVRVLD